MKGDIAQRLNALPGRITRDDVLQGRGLGNELAFFVFEYESIDEMTIRKYLGGLVTKLRESSVDLNVACLNLSSLIFEKLDQSGLKDRALKMESTVGILQTLDTLRNFATSQEIAQLIVEKHPPVERDLYILHGVGSAFPILRAHGVLSALHSRLEGKPLILFFPGKYTGTRLILFDKIQDDHYYRAFRLFGEE